MTPQTLDMFAGAIKDFADGPRLGSLEKLTEALMRRFAEKGFTLEQLADRRMMNMSERALKGHCRKLRLAFADYTPPDMRTTIEFVQRGDFFELAGPYSSAVAHVLELAVTTRGGVKSVGVPLHTAKDAKAALLKAGYVAKMIKAPKKAKVKAHA